MKISRLAPWVLTFAHGTIQLAAHDGTDEIPTVQDEAHPERIFQNTGEATDEEESQRMLHHRHHADTKCKGTTLSRGEKLFPDESICARIDGEMVYYGIRTFPGWPGYTLYREEVWSEFGNFNKWFVGVATTALPSNVYISMQGDGNLIFYGQSSACLAQHVHRGPRIRAEMGGPLPALMTVYDDDDNVLWTYSEMTRSYNGEKYIGQSFCQFDNEPKCVRVLREGQRLKWNEYVCEYDESGNAVTRFGLSSNGKLGLWRNGELVWRPRNYRPGHRPHIRGDYLRLQHDGHLTLFYYNTTRPISEGRTYTWISHCRGTGHSRIVVSNGDVLHLNQDGSMAWTVVGAKEPGPVCFPACANPSE